jgi:hypothetical protein
MKAAEVASLRDNSDDMMKSKESLVDKTIQTNMLIPEKMIEEKNTRWKALQENKARRTAFEERRVLV